MAKMTKDFQNALERAGLEAEEIAQVEVGGVTNQKRLDSMLARARTTSDAARSVSEQLSVSAGVANLVLDHWPAPAASAPAQLADKDSEVPTQANPSGATTTPSSSANGGLEQLLKRLIPPQTLMEALILLADDPTEERSQQFWLQFAGADATLLAESAPGVIDLETSKTAVTIFNESGASPDEYDGKPLYTLAQFLKKVVIVCVLTGDRLIQGKGLKTGVSYRLLGLKTDNLEQAKTLPGVQLLAFAASERLISTGNTDAAKLTISELGTLIRGLDTMAAVKDVVDGSQWADVIRQIELDQRAGGSKMTAALTRLVGTVAPTRQGSRPVSNNTLGNLVDGLAATRDPLNTNGGRSSSGSVW